MEQSEDSSVVESGDKIDGKVERGTYLMES